MLNSLGINNFANLPSKKMYQFLSKKLSNKEITHQDIADTFEAYQANASGYMYAIKTGISIKLEHVLKAQKHFGLNPCDLFRVTKIEEYATGEEITQLQEPLERIESSMDLIRSQQATIKSQQETIAFLTVGEKKKIIS